MSFGTTSILITFHKIIFLQLISLYYTVDLPATSVLVTGQPWVAQYLVNRATIGPNLHTLYLAFIDSLIDWPLMGLVLQETYTQINALLLATSLNHSADGSGLKGLGHWLGLQTLAKDSCVSDTELPVREIFIKAAHKGPSILLPLVIFVGQLFRSCDQNRIFPFHPWIMDILLLLDQLCGLSSSSCCLCLEIEIIFQTLFVHFHLSW